MKRVVVHSVSVIALLVGMAAVAAAQEGATCHAAGEWAYTKTGTLLLPTGPVPYAAVGKFSFGADGVLSGWQDSSTGGAVARNLLAGTVSMEADCSGVAVVHVYDEAGVTLLRTAVMTLVADDNTREARGIVTRLTLPNGAVIPQVVTVVARRVRNNLGLK